MPTPSHEEPLKPESVEEIGFIGPLIREFNEMFQCGKAENHIYYAGISYVGKGKEMSIQDFINFAYAQGRASMKKDIEEVVPEKREENPIWDPVNVTFNECRSEFLANIEGVEV